MQNKNDNILGRYKMTIYSMIIIIYSEDKLTSSYYLSLNTTD